MKAITQDWEAGAGALLLLCSPPTDADVASLHAALLELSNVKNENGSIWSSFGDFERRVVDVQGNIYFNLVTVSYADVFVTGSSVTYFVATETGSQLTNQSLPATSPEQVLFLLLSSYDTTLTIS